MYMSMDLHGYTCILVCFGTIAFKVPGTQQSQKLLDPFLSIFYACTLFLIHSELLSSSVMNPNFKIQPVV